MSHTFSGGFALGLVTAGAAALMYLSLAPKPVFKKNGTVINTDDDCLSLYYGSNEDEDGSGFAENLEVDSSVVERMKIVHAEYSRLPSDFYKSVVANMILCCVDVVCQRASDGKILLFRRSDSPAARIWWWPGGRMFKGETFYETAHRKLRGETGYSKDTKMTSIGVIGVWNTFFPDSNWDKEMIPGREGTQTVNISVVLRLHDSSNGTDASVDHDALKKWAVDEVRWVTVEEALDTEKFDKYVTLNVKKARSMGYLS